MNISIVDTLDDFNELKNQLTIESKSKWLFRWVDDNKHPQNTKISFVSILINNTLYVIGCNHIDLIPFEYTKIQELLQIKSKKYIFQTKKVLHTFDIVDYLDLDSCYFLQFYDKIQYDSFFDLDYFMKRLGFEEDNTQSIPIMTWIDSIIHFLNEYDFDINEDIKGLDWYSHTYLSVLTDLERTGLYIQKDMFTAAFPKATIQIRNDNKVFTEYNPYTITGRPSNAHGGVNYLALNKDDGTRDMFHANGGVLAQMDYDAHHVRLIGKLVGYELPTTSAHQWLADQYECSYEESKGITFRILYGGIDEEFLQIPFYNQTQQYIDKLWEKSTKTGVLKTLYREIPLKYIENPTPQKIFNYLLQAIELEKNIIIIQKLFRFLNDKNIYLLLYMYDSLLFHSPSIENWNRYENDIKHIMSDSEFPVRTSHGNTLGEL